MMDTEKPHTKPTTAVTSDSPPGCWHPRLTHTLRRRAHAHTLTPTHVYKDREAHLGNTLRNTGICMQVHTPTGTQDGVHRDVQTLWQCSALPTNIACAWPVIERAESAGNMEKTGHGQHSSKFPGCLAFLPGTILSQSHCTTLDT